MNVFNNPNIQRLTRVLQTDGDSKHKVRSSNDTGKSSSSDSVNLSQEARILVGIKRRLSESPDLRFDKIAALKDAISNKSYDPKSEDIAEAMLKEGKLP